MAVPEQQCEDNGGGVHTCLGEVVVVGTGGKYVV